MAKTTEQKLAAYGYTMQEATEYVYAMVNGGYGAALGQKVYELGLNAQDVANIASVSKHEVVDYFNYAGLDGHLLNSDITKFTLISDLSGKVYLSNPESGQSKLVADFKKDIFDIATDQNGDIYASYGNNIYRYDFSTGSVDTVAVIPGKQFVPDGMAFLGDMLVLTDDKDIWLTTKTGTIAAHFNIPFANADYAGTSQDIVVIGDKLYRPAEDSISVTDINTGETTKFEGKYPTSNGTKVYDYYSTEGLVNIGDGWVVSYDYRDYAAATNLQTGEVKMLPDVQGIDVLQGASEARQMHVDLWGIPA